MKLPFSRPVWTFAGLLAMLVALALWNKGSIVSLVMSKNWDALEKMPFYECIDGGTDFHVTRKCLDGFDSNYLVLGDTIDGNFKVVFQKPFATKYAVASKWKLAGQGMEGWYPGKRRPCFLHQKSEIPELSEKEKSLLKIHMDSWIEKNPEAFGRYISRVEENQSEVIIHSQPLARLLDYDEYCEDGIMSKYLDVYDGYELDVIRIEK